MTDMRQAATARPYPFGEPDRLIVDPLYAQLREQQPVIRVRLPFGEEAWLATRYQDVKTVLGDPRFSRAAGVGRDEPRITPMPIAGGILSMDPPDHSRLRRLVAKAFTARRVELLRPATTAIANELIDDLRTAGPPADLVEQFATPLPVRVICRLLGVPETDQRLFHVWSEAIVSTNDRLTEQEMVELAAGLLAAGHETTVTQIPNFVYVLLTHPDELARLRAAPDLLPAAVEELLRYVPLGVAATFARYAVEDVDLSGVRIRAGEPVIASLSSANRDGTVFDGPDRLDLGRQTNPHVGFGHGVHHCIGAQLARMEVQVALDALLTRLPALHLAVEEKDLEWKSGLLVRGLRRMPVAW